MRKLVALSIIVFGVAGAVPAVAQGVYIGPNGVGVDPGIRPDRGYDRDREYRRDENDRRDAYRERRDRYENQRDYRRRDDD